MDVIPLVFLIGISILIGVILTLVVQSYIFVKCFIKRPIVVPKKNKPYTEACTLPDALRDKLKTEGSNSENASLALSLMLQFLFHELRHSDSIKRWLYKKLSMEFEELITKTTTGKFFDSVTIRDMHLGSEAPILKTVGVEQVKLDKTEDYIDVLNICTKVVYSGNFMISVDAKMKFGKTAYLSITVKRVSGLARLQFTRLPYTHWSFSFYDEPDIELAVESHFQGRQLQSNVTNLIMNQIKKAIKRKHTLPNYKIRYKPFFVKADPGQMDTDDNEIPAQGQLELMCVEVSRLAASADILQVYCTFTTDTIPWICIYIKDAVTFMVVDLTVLKVRQQPLGATFKQEQNLVIVDNVTAQSPCDLAGLKSGDILMSIDSKNVNNISHAIKLLKLIASVSFSLRVERIVNNYVWRSKSTDSKSNLNVTTSDDLASHSDLETFTVIETTKCKMDAMPELSKRSKSITNIERLKGDKLPKLISGSNENVSKLAHTIGNFTLRKRKSSIERSASDTTTRATPAPSTPSTPQHRAHTVSVPSMLVIGSKRHYIAELPEQSKMDAADNADEAIALMRSEMKELNAIVSFNDEYMFELRADDKYLNVNVWGVTSNNTEALLGYLNIPLNQVLNECCNSVVGHYIQKYSLLPPTNVLPTSQSHPLMSHSGFEHVFCYGDVLLSFMWTNDGSSEVQRKQRINSFTEGLSPATEPITEHHDFYRTQFHRTVYCDFCTKKIWLKDAVTCRKCEMRCHKKCVSKCLLNTACYPEKSGATGETGDSQQPEITTTDVDDDFESDAIIIGGIKRVNSANSLSIPGSLSPHSQSRSLPQSPQRTPRKLSLVASNPFTGCPNALDEIYLQSADAPALIQNLVDEMIQYPPDESLMDAAKESGIHMYTNVPHQLRIEKINMMVSELKRTLDSITMEHMEMTGKLNTTDSEVEKAKLAFLIGQADAKIQALSVLMLHYCSSLQQTPDRIV